MRAKSFKTWDGFDVTVFSNAWGKLVCIDRGNRCVVKVAVFPDATEVVYMDYENADEEIVIAEAEKYAARLI
jgi:hypothetical protein